MIKIDLRKNKQVIKTNTNDYFIELNSIDEMLTTVSLKYYIDSVYSTTNEVFFVNVYGLTNEQKKLLIIDYIKDLKKKHCTKLSWLEI